MPYITRENRAALNVIIDGLVGRLQGIDAKRGDVNYVITRIVLETLNKDSYHSLSDCVSVLRDAADEIARRLLGPYEDTAILKNGDMECYDKPYAIMPITVDLQALINETAEGTYITAAEAACDIKDAALELADAVEEERRQKQEEDRLGKIINGDTP